jgi:hypothetical protein
VPVGTVDAVLSYCHNNLADNTLTGILPYLQEKKVAVISASFSSMGLLTQKVRWFLHTILRVPARYVPACAGAVSIRTQHVHHLDTHWIKHITEDQIVKFSGSAVVAPCLGRGKGSSDKGKGAVRVKGHRPRAHRHQALAQVGGVACS